MKISISKWMAAIVALAAGAGVAQAALVSISFSGPSEDVPDGSYIGIANSLSVVDPGGAILGVSVSLNISGGYNGDLYSYLLFQPTTVGQPAEMLVLLNQIGTSASPYNPFGSPTAGFNNVILSDSGSGGDVHNATGTPGQPLTGSYTPDSAFTFDDTFTGSATGTWTLFVADLTAGGGSGDSELNGWTLNVIVIPEPVQEWAVGLAALLGAAVMVAGRRRQLRRTEVNALAGRS